MTIPSAAGIKIGGAGGSNPWMTIVGVVGSVRHFGLDEPVHREMFRPYSQAAWPVMAVVAKTASDPVAFASAVRASLQQIDPICRCRASRRWKALNRSRWDRDGSR